MPGPISPSTQTLVLQHTTTTDAPDTGIKTKALPEKEHEVEVDRFVAAAERPQSFRRTPLMVAVQQALLSRDTSALAELLKDAGVLSSINQAMTGPTGRQYTAMDLAVAPLSSDPNVPIARQITQMLIDKGAFARERDGLWESVQDTQE